MTRQTQTTCTCGTTLASSDGRHYPTAGCLLHPRDYFGKGSR